MADNLAATEGRTGAGHRTAPAAGAAAAPKQVFGVAEGASVALDWYILEPDAYHEFSSHRRRWFRHGRGVAREPGAHVAMEEDAHHALLSRCGHLPLLRRAVDYYEDAAYAPDEISGLLDELVSVSPLAGAAAELEALCREALRRRCGLLALAD